MKIGYVMLVHDRFHRAEATSRFLAEGGTPVAIHIDYSSAWGYQEAFPLVAGRDVFSKIDCEWGRFNLIEATLLALRRLISANPDLTHVQLLSGSCLPIATQKDLRKHIAKSPDCDFIDVAKLEDDDWVIDGLSHERLTLYHPFDWRSQKQLFNLNVALQRFLRIRRKLPDGLTPAIGSQWWCLTRETIDHILNDDVTMTLSAFMRHSWIPDESFFQILALRFQRKPPEPSLTLAGFDKRGIPYTFYEDHQGFLEDNGKFFVRKIHPQAEKLYEHFLNPKRKAPKKADRNPEHLDKKPKDLSGRSHLPSPMLGQYLNPKDRKTALSFAPFVVFAGFGEIYENFETVFDDLSQVHQYSGVFRRAWPPSRYPLELKQSHAITPQLFKRNPGYVLSILLNENAGGINVLKFDPGDQHGAWSKILQSRSAVVVWLSESWRLRAYGRSDTRQSRCRAVYDKLFSGDVFARARAERVEITLEDLIENDFSGLASSFSADTGDAVLSALARLRLKPEAAEMLHEIIKGQSAIDHDAD